MFLDIPHYPNPSLSTLFDFNIVKYAVDEMLHVRILVLGQLLEDKAATRS